MQTLSTAQTFKIARNKTQAKGKNVANEEKQATPAAFLDKLLETLQLKNDRRLAASLGTQAPDISKIRNGKKMPSAPLLIRAHELTGWTFVYIREVLNLRPDHKF